MTPERWCAVESVFAQALAASPQERERLVAQRCADDASLKAEVLALLGAHEKAAAEGFLELPPWILEEVPAELADFGDYRNVEYLGHGAMGVVYKAFDQKLDKWFALKMGLSRWRVAEEDRQRFVAEARSMVRLQHKHIVRVYGVDEHEGRPYVKMELIAGPALGRELARFRGATRREEEVVEAVAGAVHHAHQRGFLHRDLKPENVLLDDEGQPHVTDFGLARRVDDESAPRGLEGTAAYMSPEQADPEQSETVRSDVYSLGAILYALLTGRPPHRGRDREETLRLVREARPDPPHRFNPDLARDLEAVCLKCLRREPEQRYGSAAALAEDLARWRDGAETTARPWSRLERWRGWFRRNPALAWLGTAVVILIAVAGAFVVRAAVDMAREPARAQQALARQQAGTIKIRLLQLAQAVDATASAGALSQLASRRDLGGLQRAIEATGQRLKDLDGQSPFESWFVADLRGRIVARWPAMSNELTGLDVRPRDYFRGALERGGRRAYISRVYYGRSDGRYRFAVARALVHEGETVAVLIATVTTSPALGLPAMGGHGSRMALIARLDPYRIAPGPGGSAEHVLLVHPAYRRGAEPVLLSQAQSRALDRGVNDGYADPAAALDRSLRGRWLAGLARVEGTELVVVAQRRHPRGLAREVWPAAAVCGVLAFALLWWRRRR